MPYRHRAPRPPLDSFVESIWVYQNDPRPNALERILPTGRARYSPALHGVRLPFALAVINAVREMVTTVREDLRKEPRR